jgi:hypothetical protein
MKRITAPRTLGQSLRTGTTVKMPGGVGSSTTGPWTPSAVPQAGTVGCFHDGEPLWPDCRD